MVTFWRCWGSKFYSSFHSPRFIWLAISSAPKSMFSLVCRWSCRSVCLLFLVSLRIPDWYTVLSLIDYRGHGSTPWALFDSRPSNLTLYLLLDSHNRPQLARAVHSDPTRGGCKHVVRYLIPRVLYSLQIFFYKVRNWKMSPSEEPPKSLNVPWNTRAVWIDRVCLPSLLLSLYAFMVFFF